MKNLLLLISSLLYTSCITIKPQEIVLNKYGKPLYVIAAYSDTIGSTKFKLFIEDSTEAINARKYFFLLKNEIKKANNE